MKKLKVIGVLMLSIVMCQCTQLKQLSAFSKCEFRMKNIHSVKLSGVNMDNKKSYNDMNLLEIGKITKGYVSGNLPLDFVIDVEVKNPNAETAALTKTEWKAFLDDNQMAQSTLEERIEIGPNGGVGLMKILVHADVRETVSVGGTKDLINLVSNLYGAGNEPSKIQLQLKPSIKVGKGSVNYPGYIRVSKIFGAE